MRVGRWANLSTQNYITEHLILCSVSKTVTIGCPLGYMTYLPRSGSHLMEQACIQSEKNSLSSTEWTGLALENFEDKKLSD